MFPIILVFPVPQRTFQELVMQAKNSGSHSFIELFASYPGCWWAQQLMRWPESGSAFIWQRQSTCISGDLATWIQLVLCGSLYFIPWLFSSACRWHSECLYSWNPSYLLKYHQRRQPYFALCYVQILFYVMYKYSFSWIPTFKRS